MIDALLLRFFCSHQKIEINDKIKNALKKTKSNDQVPFLDHFMESLQYVGKLSSIIRTS